MELVAQKKDLEFNIIVFMFEQQELKKQLLNTAKHLGK